MSNPPQDPHKPEEQPQHGLTPPAAPPAGPTPDQQAPGQQPAPAPEQPAQAGQQPATNQPWQPPAQPPRPQYGEMAPRQQPDQRYGQPYGKPAYDATAQPQAPYSYQAAQPSAYGYPGGGSQVQHPQGPIATPKEVLISFWLLISAAVLTAITTIAILATIRSGDARAELDAMIAEQNTEVPMDAQALVDIAAVFIAVVAVVGIVIYVLLAFLVKKGKNWARITGTVLAVLSLLTLIGADWLWILTILLGVAAIVLLFMPASNNFFNAHKARKQPAFGR